MAPAVPPLIPPSLRENSKARAGAPIRKGGAGCSNAEADGRAQGSRCIPLSDERKGETRQRPVCDARQCYRFKALPELLLLRDFSDLENFAEAFFDRHLRDAFEDVQVLLLSKPYRLLLLDASRALPWAANSLCKR